MNASSYDKGNDYEDFPKTPYDGENMNAYYNNEEDNDEVVTGPTTDDENINDNPDDEKTMTRLPLIHL